GQAVRVRNYQPRVNAAHPRNRSLEVAWATIMHSKGNSGQELCRYRTAQRNKIFSPISWGIDLFMLVFLLVRKQANWLFFNIVKAIQCICGGHNIRQQVQRI
ncbi:MAG: hypothetical protein ACU0DI_14805, partial [Paracoccaceae bacterium]